jgi:hypothetical protein
VLLVVLGCSRLAAGDAPEPSRWIGPHPLVTVQAHDVQRTLARFSASPYGDCGGTAWGALLVERLRAFGGVDLGELAGSIDRVAIGVGMREEDRSPDIRWAVSTGADAGPMERLCDRLSPELRGVGRIARSGRVFTFRRADGSAEPAEAAATRFPEDCFELALDAGALGQLLGVAAPAADAPERPIVVGVRLDPIGMREHWDLPVAATRKWADVHLPPAHRELLAGLPSGALMGCTFTADGSANVAALACSGLVDDPLALIAIDLSLARCGLPPLLDLIGGLRGDTVMWLEDGSPYPTFTVIAGMDERLARRLLPILALGANLAPGADGTLVGFLGVCAFEAGYRDGRLILTTHPEGVAGAMARAGGFAAHPDAAAALAEIPAGAVFAGASRSGPAAAALTRLALEPLAHLGVPQLAALPRDLERRGRHGFIALRQVDDGLRLEAGGMLGGPCAAYATLGGAAWAVYTVISKRVAEELERLHDLKSAPPAEGTARSM